jgi:hypothetical protein
VFPEQLEQRHLMAVVGGVDERFSLPAVTGLQLVVIDASLASDPGIVSSFGSDSSLLFESDSADLFADVSAALAANAGVSSIHLVSHGMPGRFSLGSSTFDAASVDDFADGLVAWSRLAAPGADLYIWGCDVAGGDGASLIDTIHAASGFDVAASTDVTGPAALGGDFDLEYTAGDVAAPRLVAGVDVLWDTTLAAPTSYSFTEADVKAAVTSAFSRLQNDIAPAVSTALTNRVSGQTVDAYSQRTVADLFTSATSVSPTDVASMLSLATAATTYLGAASPTLAGLAAALQTRLGEIVASAGSGSASATVTPKIVSDANDTVTKIELDVTIAATGTTTQPVDRGTDAAPTTWGRLYQDLNSAVNLTLRDTPVLRSGTTFSGAFTVTVDLADSSNPVASIAIPTLDLTGGFFGHAATAVRFGALDAALSASASPSLLTSVSFSGGAERTVAGWSTVGASASALPTPSGVRP